MVNYIQPKSKINCFNDWKFWHSERQNHFDVHALYYFPIEFVRKCALQLALSLTFAYKFQVSTRNITLKNDSM